jgi:Zn-finger nucleic acid-binding protein
MRTGNVPLPNSGELELDYCKSCQVLWTDPGEFERLAVANKVSSGQVPIDIALRTIAQDLIQSARDNAENAYHREKIAREDEERAKFAKIALMIMAISR